MRREQEMRQIALQISIALAAGIFSFIPSVSAAPVLNEGSTKTTAGVAVNSTTDTTNFPNVAITDVTATQRNNVVDWQDFSVAKDEMVRFDGGNKTNNYLNLVSGGNTSHIDGAIQGGKDVYIVNPNGVIFGNSASVDVGSLYVSTRPIADVDLSTVGDTTTTTDMTPLANAVSMSGNAAAIVNMGDVQATSVSVEGGNIILADVNRIKTADGSAVNTNVTIKNIGATTGISLGHSVTDVVAAGSNADTLMNNTGAGYTYTGGNYSSANKVVSIRNESELENVAAAGLGRNYLLIDDITLTNNHTPIGGDTPFTGNFDGQFHTISNVNVPSTNYGGLFGYTSGGTVKNLGVQGGSITAANDGGIVGKAQSTTVKNVFNNGTSINRQNASSTIGGIVGYAENSTVSSAYNTGSVTASEFNAGGIVGAAYSTIIENVYNTGETRNGLVGKGNNGSITNAYASQTTLHSNMYNNTVTKTNILGNPTSKNAADYTGFDISNKGGENTVWRIYEGQSLPLLRSFLTANGTVTVNYNYTHGSESGSNGGADLTADDLTYNGSPVTVNGTPAYSGANNIDTSKIFYANNSVRTVPTKALFWSEQQGYDLIGNNVTMAKKQLSLSGSSMGITKVYDKSADATSAVTTVLSTATNISGVVSGDDVSLNPAGITATYVDADGNADATVGPHNITLAGTVNLTGTDAGNYTLEATDLSTLASVTGTITQRPIYLISNLENVNFTKNYDGDNSLSITNSQTGAALSGDDIFSLETTSSSVGTQDPNHGKISDDEVNLAFGGTGTPNPSYVDIVSGNFVSTDNAANAGEHSVMFSGIALSGADAGNYMLCYNGTTDPVVNSQVLLRSGVDVNTGAADSIRAVIRPRLLATDGFQVRTPTGQTDSAGNPIYTTAAANKTYDGTSTYEVPAGSVLIANTAAANSSSGLLPADSTNLWFALSSAGGNSTNFVDSTGAATKMAAGANAAVGVAYAVDANTNIGYEYLKGNYTFNSATAASNNVTDWQTLNDAIPTVSGAGTISRRNILIDTSNVMGIDKPYDGNANVIGDNYTTIGGGYLDYASDSPKKLLRDDSTIPAAVANADNVAWSVTAAYDNKNVVRGADGVSVPDNAKNVNFTVALTGTDAVNYVLNGTNAETSSVPLTGTGKITPVVLTPTFVDISKTYNGTTAVNDGDSSAVSGSITLPTITAGDDVQLVPDANAAYYYNTSTGQAESNAGSWAVRYPNLRLEGNDSANYNLSTETGSGNGTINRRLILSDGFQVNNGGTVANGTKVYDGTSIYNVPSGATLVANTTASGNTGVIDADRDNLWFSLSNTVASNFINTQNANTPTAKVAEANGIAYQVQANTAAGYGYLLNNYKIGTTASSTPLAADTTYAVTGAGNITRRALTIDISNAVNINKEYNANTDLVGAGDINIGGAYLNYTDGSAETSKLLADDSTATAAGVSDTAAWSVSAAYDNKNVVRDADGNVIDNGKTVNFNISITGDDAANYTLNGVNAETTGAAPITLTGTGKITPKELTASFSPVSKIYNGTTRINDRDSSVTGNGTVTPLTGDTVTLNYNEDEAYYDTPDVGTDKTVYYPNLTLTGADSGNYKLTSTLGLGTGTITTATVTLDNFVFNFAGVNRVYNGETAVADSAQGITADQFITDSYINLGTGTFDFRDYIRNLNANYASKDVNANTGTGNVTYSFNLADMTIPNISITGDYQNYFANNPVTRSVGTITPKTVYATINNPVVTKTYNGAYDVQNYTAPLVSYSGLVGDSADASTAVYLDKNQGTDKLVQYDVAISDGSNYVIKYNSVEDAANMATYRTAANGPVVTADDVITTIVTPNNVINPKDVRLTFVDVTKQYDGTTSVQPVADQVALGATTMSGVESGDTITLTGWNAVYNSPDVLTANTVSYSNITLSGNDNGNYNFIDANGNSLNANTVIDGNGAITPLTLSGTYAFTLGDVTKEYDSTNAIKFTGTGTDGTEYYRDSSAAAIKNFITAPSLTINGASRQMGYELDMGNTGYNGTTVGEHPATFRVGISNSNYTFDSITVTDGTNTLTPTVENGVYYYNLTKNNATITPRKVYVALNDNPAITKVYDGTNAVEQVVTGNNNKVYLRDSTDFISGDNVDVDWNNISAVYSSENVAYDGEGNVTSQDVIYNVGLIGTDAGNYVLYRAADNTAITDANKLTGTGIITPRELTVDFARDEHIYNNSAYLTNPGNNLRLGNLANRDAGFELDSIAKRAIGGRYTDKDVNRAADGTVLDKGLTYNNLQNALADYATRNAIAKNYIMPVDSVTYSVDDAKGVIKPLEITDPLKAVWQENVNKTYDATTNLPTGTDANSVLTLQVNTAYDGNLTLQADDNGYQYDVNTVGYVSKNQGDRALTYTVTGVNPNQGNYQLSDSVVNAALAVPWVSTEATRNMEGNAVTGHISPRTLTIVTENDSKIYNGETDVANAKSKIHFTDEDQAIINNDTDAVDYTVTANYRDKNAGDGITIDYTLTLTGNDNGNYVLNSGTGTAVGTTTGDIAKRKVYVEPVDVDGIDKVYDKTTDLPEGFTNTGRFKLADTDDTTGIVAGEEDIQLDFDAIQGEYDSEHAGLRTITFNNFNLVDTNLLNDDLVGNYTLETSSIDGSGTISPKGLVVGINAAPTKEYDTFNNISDYYAGVDNLYLRGESAGDAGLIGDDQVNLQVNSANYATRDAGVDKEYSYGISIDNTDYKLVQGNNLPTITVSNDGQSGTVTAYDGEITKRKVYVSLANTPDIVKTYDGNTSVEQDVTNKIIVRDGDLLNDGTELNRDESVINAHYDVKDAGDRNVIYNAQLKGAAAGNYEIHQLSNINDAAADVESSTLVGTGIINKAKLTLDPAVMSKTYNGTAVIGDGTAVGDDAWTPDKLVFKGVNNESFILTDEAFAQVSGQYGFGDGDANVSWNGNEVAYKDVQYTGLNDALTVMNADASTNEISKNYTIDNTAYFDAAQAKGMIKPITITQPAKENWKSVIREYNADTDLSEVYDYSSGTQGQLLGLKDILTLTVDDVNGNTLNIDYEAIGSYDNKNAGDKHVLNYQLSSVDPKVKDINGNKNYMLSSSVVEALTSGVLDSSAEQVYSVITPRQLNATLLKAADVRKIYDGTRDGDTSNFVLNADDQAILAKDELLNQFAITAKYNNKNASVAPNEADSNSKTITYTMTLNGGGDNYVIATPTAEAMGDIEQRRVYVKPVDIQNIDKVYDGTKALPIGFTNADHFQLAATDATTGIVAGDEDIQLNTGVIQGEYDSEHAGPRTIAFTNFELQDTDTESINSGRLTNYSLETASLDGSGTISPKGLVVGINEAPIKEYDTFKNISAKYAGVDNLYLRGEDGKAGLIGDDQVNLQVNSADYIDANAGKNKEYSYGVSIDNADYKLVQGNNLPAITVSNDGQSGVVTAYDGTITKRKVYVSLDDAPDIVKTYDGNTSVKQDVTNKIIVRDGDLLNDGTELNRDASVINAHYDAKDAGDRNVIYNAQLKGSAAGNYEIHQLSNINDTAADVESSTLVGTGIINKAKLTLDPATMSKTYNGTALIGDGKSAGDDAWTPDKLVFKGVNNESFTLTDEAFAKVIGQYGYGKGDANVSWAGDEVAYKDVQYTGLSDALAVMNADASTNEISKNYTIDNTAVFDAAQAKGKINPVTITQAAKENWKPVIREYNADTDLSEVYDYSSGTPGQQLGINDILTLTVMDADGNPLTIDYTATGNYDHKNVGGTHVLNYHIDSVNKKVNDGKGEGNYVLDTSVLDALQDKNLDSAAEQVYSVITPRQLNAEVLKATDNRKIYDGTADADTGNFVLDKADQEILSQDNLLNNVVITAYYDNENASIAPDGEAANSKTITYTLGLNDDSGNYQIATPTAEALGDIEQRRVYVEALDVNNIDKIYDGTTAVPDGYTRDGRFALTAADESTGIVVGDEDILLNTAAISGQYASAHVQRDADGRPTAQAVRFSNFTLQDANAGNNNHAGNYYVATDSLQGSGTITPKGLTVGIKESPVKVYDGETALASTYAANDNLVLEGLIAGDNANLLIDSAAYADANAGKNKEYSYQISLGNDDYELVQGTDKPALTVTDNGQSGTVTAQDGTITPRTLTASVIQDMTKVYDGTTDGAAMENPEDYILLSNNYLAKDKDSLGLTAVAVFDGANAGKSEDTDELEQHKVTYTLNLANTNYELADNTVTGEGTIYRKGLNIVAEPVSVLAGDKMPVFSGTVEGLLPSESGLADLFSFAPDSTTTTNVPGSYAVYGWYNNRFSGNLGQNYSFAQDAKNETAFTVGYLDNTGNPDLKFTPTRNIYQQISKDMGSGFGDNGMAAIEYVNKDGQIVGREMVDSGEIHGGSNASMSITGVDSNSTNLANIGISGGDVVNMEGADAASLANIEVDGDGSIVNLQVMPVDGEQSADGRSSAAEIVAADETGNVHNSSASIQIVDDSGNVLEEENEDKAEKQKKKGEIAIEAEDSQNKDEIELEVKGVGVNVA